MVDPPEISVGPTKTSLLVSIGVFDNRHSDILNNTFVVFQLFSNDGQFLDSQQGLFAFRSDNPGVEASVIFQQLQSGMNYTIHYLYHIGSFEHTDEVTRMTSPSGEKE